MPFDRRSDYRADPLRGAALKARRNSETDRGSDYDPEEVAFLAAVDAYRGRFKRRFMNASEYLAVLKSLGYRRPDA